MFEIHLLKLVFHSKLPIAGQKSYKFMKAKGGPLTSDLP